MLKKKLRATLLATVVLALGGGAPALADTSPTTTDPTGTATAPSTAAPAPPPAPPGFANSLVSLYDEQYDAITALNGAGSDFASQQLPMPSDFQQDVDSLNSEELAQLYAATQQPNSQWSTLASTYQQLDKVASTYSSSSTSGAPVASARSPRTARSRSTARNRASAAHRKRRRRVHAASGSARRGDAIHASAITTGSAAGTTGTATGATGSGSASPFPPAEPTGDFPAPPSLFSPDDPVREPDLISCPAGAPGGPEESPGDDAIFSAQLTADVAGNVADDVPDELVIAGESIPDPAKYVAEAIALAATVTLDTFNYLQAVFVDCDSENKNKFLENIDNTTRQGYALESETIQPTLDAVESSINTIHDQVHAVQQSVDAQLTLDIQQALALSSSAPANVDYILPASVGGNLDSTPIGVQEIVTAAFAAARQAGLTINPIVSREITAANGALAAHQYRTAWSDYQAAYQALGS